MARIAGVNIPNHAHAVIGLQAIFGIGQTRAQQICVASNVSILARPGMLQLTTLKDLTSIWITFIQRYIPSSILSGLANCP